jgi:hypothetical protein
MASLRHPHAIQMRCDVDPEPIGRAIEGLTGDVQHPLWRGRSERSVVGRMADSDRKAGYEPESVFVLLSLVRLLFRLTAKGE